MKKLLTKYWPVTIFVISSLAGALAYGAKTTHKHAEAVDARQTKAVEQVARTAVESMKAMTLMIQGQRIQEMTDRTLEIEAKPLPSAADRLRVLQLKKSLGLARESVKKLEAI